MVEVLIRPGEAIDVENLTRRVRAATKDREVRTQIVAQDSELRQRVRWCRPQALRFLGWHGTVPVFFSVEQITQARRAGAGTREPPLAERFTAPGDPAKRPAGPSGGGRAQARPRGGAAAGPGLSQPSGEGARQNSVGTVKSYADGTSLSNGFSQCQRLAARGILSARCRPCRRLIPMTLRGAL